MKDKLARVKLEEEGFEEQTGIVVKDMTTAQALHYSRVGPFDGDVAELPEKDAEAIRLAHSGEWQLLNEQQRWAACRALNISSPAFMDKYIASLSDSGEEA